MVPQRFASLMVSWMLHYFATSLRPHFSLSSEIKLPDHRFMQDNDPKHTPRKAKTFFKDNNINWWRSPAESPDLNPIKNLWHKLKLYLESKVKPRNKQEFVDGIKEFWAKKVTPEKCAKYIDHVLHKAIPAIVDAQGAATKF